jgi:hypothetical protein
MVRGMGGLKFRANSMALYAVFLATVGLPMLALGVDFSRVEMMRVKLRGATEAACQAYANSLDISEFQESGELNFENATRNAYLVFQSTMNAGAAFTAYENRKSDDGATKVVIICTGGVSIRPFIPVVTNYYISTNATIKTKFSTDGKLN